MILTLIVLDEIPHMADIEYKPGVEVDNGAVAKSAGEAIAPLHTGFSAGQYPDGVGMAVTVTEPWLYPMGMTSVSLFPGVAVVDVTFSQDSDATPTTHNGTVSLPPWVAVRATSCGPLECSTPPSILNTVYVAFPVNVIE